MNFSRTPSKMYSIFGCIKFDGVASGKKVLKKSVHSGIPGAGVGKGGGAGGSIKESGGGLGKMGAAREESYFYEKQKKQLRKMKRKLEQSKSEDPPNQDKKNP